ncbi:MAG: hypothetical protein HN348_03585 [Proteobacteria bacterium]|jgi:hypothetical protein|nr:hypothetical protein [Pseudomonadota bacterium]
MANERKGVRGVALVEDRRTASFLRKLWTTLGFHPRKLYFEHVPHGKGAGDSWVIARYPKAVQALRAKHREQRCVIAFIDGDRFGVAARKAQLNTALTNTNLSPRTQDERIATLIPTWSIENWLFALLGTEGINEERRPEPKGPTWKQLFDRQFAGAEKAAFLDAAAAWKEGTDNPELPSFVDGRIELARIDP